MLDWDGTTWTEEPRPGRVTRLGTGDATAIACPTHLLLCHRDGAGVSVRNCGQRWSPEQDHRPAAAGSTPISCPTASFCLAADDSGAVLTWNGSTWSPPDQVVPPATEYTGHRHVRLVPDRPVLHGHER